MLHDDYVYATITKTTAWACHFPHNLHTC